MVLLLRLPGVEVRYLHVRAMALEQSKVPQIVVCII